MSDETPLNIKAPENQENEKTGENYSRNDDKSQFFDLILFRKIPIGVKFSALLLISLGIFYLIPLKWSRSIEFSIPINIYELGEQGAGLFLKIDLKHILYIILLGPCFSIIAYILIAPLWKIKTIYNITQIENGQKSDNNRRLSSGLITFYEIAIIFFIIMNSVGHFVHMLFDKANFYYRNGLEVYDTSEIFKFVYFADEWLGHGIIHVSYFMIFFFAVFLEYENVKIKNFLSLNAPYSAKWFDIAGYILNQDDSNAKIFESVYSRVFYLMALILTSAGLSGIHGYAALEGESALILLILSIFGLFFLIIWMRKIMNKRFDLNKLIYTYPLLLINIAAFIGVIIQNVIFIQTGYWIAQYPYIT